MLHVFCFFFALSFPCLPLMIYSFKHSIFLSPKTVETQQHELAIKSVTADPREKRFIHEKEVSKLLKYTDCRIKSHNKRSGSHTLSTHSTLGAAQPSVAGP